MKLDMIIRTEESRSMGAKFLDHADLGSREECLRLCCETDDCDVFVFEEKVHFTLHAKYNANIHKTQIEQLYDRLIHLIHLN